MKILIFGENGQVAWELKRSVSVLGEVVVKGSQEANFLNPESLVKIIREHKPDRIINAAAYTAVDKAESEESLAEKINAEAVGVIAEEAKKIGAHLLHYSTDYVFNGSKSTPYIETDKTAPLNAYGRTKLHGEQFIQQVAGDFVILRVSWVYGSRGSNFYRTMLRLGAERESLSIVSDQVGAPTWCRHIADASAHIISAESLNDKSGVYHLSPQGETSWLGFAEKIFENHQKLHPEVSLKVKVLNKIETKDYPTPALRPLNSRMDASKLSNTFGVQLSSWDESLKLVFES